MESKTETYSVRVNNTETRVTTAAENPVASPKHLLSESGYHPHSWELFVDAYAGADPDDAPAAFDDRLGDRIDKDEPVDLSECQKYIAILKRNLDLSE